MIQQRCHNLTFILAIVCVTFVAGQLQFPSDEQNSDTLTTNYGVGVSNNRDSFTVGERGPTLLEVNITHYPNKFIPNYFPNLMKIFVEEILQYFNMAIILVTTIGNNG